MGWFPPSQNTRATAIVSGNDTQLLGVAKERAELKDAGNDGTQSRAMAVMEFVGPGRGSDVSDVRWVGGARVMRVGWFGQGGGRERAGFLWTGGSRRSGQAGVSACARVVREGFGSGWLGIHEFAHTGLIAVLVVAVDGECEDGGVLTLYPLVLTCLPFSSSYSLAFSLQSMLSIFYIITWQIPPECSAQLMVLARTLLYYSVVVARSILY